MVHPDYQYTPLLVTAMASMIAYDVYDVVLGSRILGGQARQDGMPWWKYVANRFLTLLKILSWARSCRSITRDTAPSAAPCSRSFRCWRIRTICF